MGSDVIAAVIVAVLVLAALALVAQPLVGGARRETDEEELRLAVDEAESKKRSALLAIVDIEEERDIGKLSDADFDALRTQYEAQALSALRELDTLSLGEAAREDELEAEIAEMRREMTCPNCGALRVPATSENDPRPCPRCGR